VAPAKLRLRDQLILAWGKVRRLYYGVFRPGYVRRKAAQRRGECRRCGTCCKLVFVCPRLDESGDVPTCKIHDDKPLNCRIFPIDERDLRDRDMVCPDEKCGFYFVEETSSKEGEQDA